MKRKFGNFSDLLSRDEMRSIIGGYDFSGPQWTKVYEQDNGVWQYVFVNSNTGHVYNILGNRLC